MSRLPTVWSATVLTRSKSSIVKGSFSTRSVRVMTPRDSFTRNQGDTVTDLFIAEIFGEVAFYLDDPAFLQRAHPNCGQMFPKGLGEFPGSFLSRSRIFFAGIGNSGSSADRQRLLFFIQQPDCYGKNIEGLRNHLRHGRAEVHGLCHSGCALGEGRPFISIIVPGPFEMMAYKPFHPPPQPVREEKN